jgi:hypothetical protein
MKQIGQHLVKTKYKLIKPKTKAYPIQYKRIFKVYKYHEYKKVNTSKKLDITSICLYFDRLDQASDNAEVLYEYMTQFPNKYFIIDHNSKDYQRLKNKGFNVVGYDTKEFKTLYKKCDFIFSSSFDFEITNYKKLARKASFNFVFLQHGVIYNDLRHHLNRRHIDYIICSTTFEKNLLKQDYLFADWQIIDSGLARFDQLKNQANNNLVLAPSWNANMRKPFSTELDLIKMEKSKFFKNIVDIILKTDAKLLLHPNYQASFQLFAKAVGQDRIYKDQQYYEIINQSSGVITDYSSIVFDFMYLKKPVYFYNLQQDFNKHIHLPNLKLGIDTPGEIINSVDQITYKPTNNDIFINHENHSQKIVEYLKNI